MSSKGFQPSARAFIVVSGASEAPGGVGRAFYRVKEASMVTGRTEKAIRRKIDKGEIQPQRASDGAVYVSHEDVARLMGVSPAWN